jgi:hypothetical protein
MAKKNQFSHVVFFHFLGKNNFTKFVKFHHPKKQIKKKKKKTVESFENKILAGFEPQILSFPGDRSRSQQATCE